ncbi:MULTISPECIES: DUF934 domain-containing protein [unclassified Iodidimonas]|jgi:uncharacterized protein (DUF934 family)|uniref:DUF934 domain-containing protein n=1 Tax=unclassified Iodidimonas TaxID=2626145 RepID=UPI0024822BBD|nr:MULTISPECIES: DUF934 domain-containing protein [unclassified Iodidimonas]
MERLDLRKLTGAHLKPYRSIDDEAPLPDEGGVLVSLARLKKDRAALAARKSPYGLLVNGDEKAANLAPHLEGLAVIAIHFGKFSDGRGFSLAHRLREDHGFSGEIRATGGLIADHAEFLLRSGVSSVELADPIIVAQFIKRLKLYSVWYQDAHDARPTALELRHGRTRKRLAS